MKMSEFIYKYKDKDIPVHVRHSRQRNIYYRYRKDGFYVSYIDMYSGVEVNEENADDYLEDDGITPNKKARRMMADRLVKLLSDRFVDRSSSDTK